MLHYLFARFQLQPSNPKCVCELRQPKNPLEAKRCELRSGRLDHPEILQASRAIMLIYSRVPYSRVMCNELIIPAERFAAVTKPLEDLELSNFRSIINTQSRWLLIAPNDITYPYTSTVNVAIVKVGRQGELKHISILRYSSLYPKTNFRTVFRSF